MPGGGHGRGMWSWWMGGWGWLWIALIVLVIVLLVVWITRRSGPTGRSGGGDDALRILEERFARGEIDREEFEGRRRTLRGGPL
jgi:putative membrane protein